MVSGPGFGVLAFGAYIGPQAPTSFLGTSVRPKKHDGPAPLKDVSSDSKFPNKALKVEDIEARGKANHNHVHGSSHNSLQSVAIWLGVDQRRNSLCSTGVVAVVLVEF